MNGWLLGILVVTIPAVITGAGTWATLRTSARVSAGEQGNRGDELAIDGARTARAIEAEAVKWLRDEYVRVTQELERIRAEGRAELETLRGEVRAERERGDRLEHELAVEKRKVDDLTNRLAAAGIALTPDN